MCDQILYQIWPTSNNPRLTYWTKSWPSFQRAVLSGLVLGSALTELYDICPSKALINKFMYFGFQICYSLSKPAPLNQISHFLGRDGRNLRAIFRRIVYAPSAWFSSVLKLERFKGHWGQNFLTSPVKIREGGEIYEWILPVRQSIKPLIYLWPGVSRPPGRLEAGCQKKEEKSSTAKLEPFRLSRAANELNGRRTAVDCLTRDRR